MKGIINNKWGIIITVVSVLGLTSCSQIPVDNTGTTSGSGGYTYNGGNGNSTGGNTSGGSVSNGGNTNVNTGNTGGTSGGTVATAYVVQLIATSSSSKAQSVKNTFAGEGYQNIKINTVTINGQAIHRVQVGPFGTQADGGRVLAQMKRRYLKNQYVNKAIVKTVYGK